MLLDQRIEWPADVPVGTYDVTLNGVEGYPESNAHIMFVCPKGQRCSVLLGPRFVDRPNPDGLCIWKWNADIHNPTIEPSINCLSEKDGKPTGGCGWHGFIKNGDIA